MKQFAKTRPSKESGLGSNDIKVLRLLEKGGGHIVLWKYRKL